MSTSSLWLVKKDFSGEEAVEYRNSWLVAPIVFNALIKKYTGSDMNFMLAFGSDENFFKELNETINNSPNQVDRVLWELVNQQAFYVKDKVFVEYCIQSFLNNNAEYLERITAEIIGRFYQLAEDIRNINEEENAMFIFKNSSIDDGVSRLFERYDEDEDDYVPCKLTDNHDGAIGITVIKDHEVVGFKRISHIVDEF